MRKTATAILLFTFVFAAIVPTFAQSGTHERTGKLLARTPFDNMRALTDGAGVLVRWQLKNEIGITAYNVYRVSNNAKQLITESAIVRSGLSGLTFGESYDFFDLDGEAGFVYVVEVIRTDGSRFVSDPSTAIAVKSLEAEIGSSSQTYITARNSANANVEERTSSITGELQDLVALHEQEPDPVNQRVIASKAGAKISVKKSGFYRVTANELQVANFPVNSDPTKWRLFMNGVEQAIIVGPNGEYIEFYGKALDTPESDTRTYYLVADTVAGKRIGSKVLRSRPGSAAATKFPVVARKKERNFYFQEIFNGDGENFLGRLVETPGTTIRFNLTGVDFSVPTAQIKINLFGYSENAHAITARINENVLPVFTQFGQVFYSGDFTIPTAHLLEGVNELHLDTRAPGDQSLFDFVEVRYQRKYTADDNKLSFFTPGFQKVDIAGFTTSSIRVFDLTFDGQPVLISNTLVEPDGSGYTAKIPSSRMMVGYAIEDTALLQSPAITENLPSTLSTPTNDAEMLIISHSSPSFMNAAETWAQYRRSAAGGRFSVKVIDVADIFDEFSYGRVEASALKSFLEYTTEEWVNDPKYVLLIGDATYDPRNYEGFGNFNLIPTQSITLLLEESFSDEALGDFDNDGLSAIAIGRIPARTAQQIDIAFNKTLVYETNQQSYNRGVLFAHDVPIGFDFENMSQQLSQRLPTGTPFDMVSVGEPNANQNVIDRINEGKFLVNYSGHGAAGLWANSGFFNIVNSVPQLTNTNNPSVFSMLTCLNGLFVRTNADSLGEGLLFHPNGGAAAAWASTGATTPDIQLIMALKFVDEMSAGETGRMGDLIKEAKTAISAGADVRLSWVLLGDPALKIP